nr:hypothetical protein [Methylobacterium sp. L1A1]
MPAPIVNSPTPPLSSLPPGKHVIQDDASIYATITVDEEGREIYRRTLDFNLGIETIIQYYQNGTSSYITSFDGQFGTTNIYNEQGWIISQEDTLVGFRKTWSYDAIGFIIQTSYLSTDEATGPQIERATGRTPEFFYTSKDVYYGPMESPSFTVLASEFGTLRISYDTSGAVNNLVQTFELGNTSKILDQWNDTSGARIPHRHLEYNRDGKIVLEDRFDSNGNLTYQTKTLDDGAHYAMSMAADGQHIQITETDGSIRIQETIRNDGSLLVTKLGDGASVESTSHDDIFTSTEGGATFVFKDGFGDDVIRNFHTGGANHDTIVLDTDREVNSWYYNGTDSIIIVGNIDYDTIILKGVNIEQLHQGDILIV